MIEPTPTAEGIFIAVIFIVAMLIFLGMLIAIFMAFRSKNQAGKETRLIDERLLDQRAKISLPAILHKMYLRAGTREDPGRSTQEEPPVNRRERSAETARINTKQTRRTALAFLGIGFSLLLLTEFALRSALCRGWTNHPGSESVNLLAVDNDDQIWAAVPGSLIRYSDEDESMRIPLPGELANDSVLSLAIDRQDRIWLGTVNGLLATRGIDDRWIVYAPTSIEAPRIGPDIVVDGQGQVWTNSPQAHGTELAGIELHPENHTYTLANAGLGLIDTLAVDSQRQLWVLIVSGELKKLEPDGIWKTFGTASKQDPDVNWAFSPFGSARLAIDRQGQAWIGVGNGVVHVLGLDGAWQTYSPDEPHPTIYTKAITIDGQGYMWGVSGGQGLYRFHPQMGWTAYNPRNSGLTATYSVTTLIADRQGRVWFGSHDGELVRFHPAAALPSKYIPVFSLLSVIVLPSVLISVGLVLVAMIVISRPAAVDRQAVPKFWTIALGTLGAALCGLYTLGQRHVLAEQFMQAVFGEGWAFADALSFFVAPALSICLVPLSVITGAALGVMMVRLAARIFPA
jgi:streptogramin lyase